MLNRIGSPSLRRNGAVLAGVALAGVLLWESVSLAAPSKDTVKDATSTDDAIHYADALSVAFEHAADTIKPAVVTIHARKNFRPAGHISERIVPRGLPGGMDLPDQLLRRFFSEGTPAPVPQEGVGSGVIVRDDGYILTNNHVVQGADEVTVTLDSGKTLAAKVVGTDPASDLAVVRVDADKLPAAQLGNSEDLRVGQWVVAAGNPFGLRDTITAGIVSAKGRADMRITEYEDFIQTDAAINPGNSGGPLVDLHGHVIGVNTAIATHTGGSNGVGFAIPINMARDIMDRLIKDGHVVRGWLGVAVQPLDEGLAKSFKYEGTEGVLIGDVLADGPARDAGLKPGDIVTRIDGTQVTSVQQFRNLIAANEPDTKVKLEVVRDGETRPITVRLAQRSADAETAGTAEQASDELGLTVETLTAEQAQSLGLDKDVNGVVVRQVSPDGLAARAGIEPGDVISQVQGEPVANAGQFRSRTAKADLHEGVRLLVQRGEMRHFVFLQESK